MDPELLTRLRDGAAKLFPARGILAAYVHGSRVVGTPRPDSDLDVGYYLREYRQGSALSLRDEGHLAAELSRVAGSSVDLRNLGDAPLELRGRVLEEGARIFSGDDAARVALEVDILGRYHDYKEEFRQMHELRLRRIAEKGL